MDPWDLPRLAALIALVLMNAFFVATEFAFVAVRRSRLDQLAAEGHAMATIARGMLDHLDAYIAACQLGITMASLALGWIGEPALAHLIEPALAGLVGGAAEGLSHGIAVGFAFVVITSLHIVFGELAPKGLALQKTEATTLWVAPGVRLFYVVFRWPILALNSVGNGALRLFGLHPVSGHGAAYSVDELRFLLASMQQAGVVEAVEARIAGRAFHLGDLPARSLMTPRIKLEAVPVTSDLASLRTLARSARHTHVLVYENSLDQVLGVLPVRDLIRTFEVSAEAFDLRAWLRPVLFVPESRTADALLTAMLAEHTEFVVVTDEFGGTAGLITWHDVLRTLVGRIDGSDAEAVARPGAGAADGAMVLDGLLRLEEVEELSGMRLDPAWHAEVDTLGGLVMTRLGRVPDVGDTTVVDGCVLRVEKMDGHRVARVRLTREHEPASARDDAPS